MARVLWSLLFVMIFKTAAVAVSPGYANVCEKTITYLENYTTTTLSSFRVKTLQWCAAVPPRCTLWKTQYRFKYKQAQRLASDVVYECCAGYQEKQGQCLPHCPSGCVHGACIAPGTCNCQHGWRGLDCDSACPPDTWGENCANTCQCVAQHGSCDVATGRCVCQPGFFGTRCQNKCPGGWFGMECGQQCRCAPSKSSCDAVTGRCQCLPGFHGPLCNQTCPEEVLGGTCPDDCACQNGGTCSPGGSCVCSPGWKGPVCAERCDEGTFGANCSQQCVCYNGGRCDLVAGSCSCPPGFTGFKCEKSCEMGRFGVNCGEVCQCENNAYCSHIDGSCTCTADFMGPLCNLPVCPLGFYGPSCASRCQCILENSECHSWSGECICHPGYHGDRCGLRCDEGSYGQGCEQQCYCTEDQLCHHVDGCVQLPAADSVNTAGAGHIERQGLLLALMTAGLVLALLAVAACLAVHYRRRYRRLKRTTQLVVQYTRAHMGDPGQSWTGIHRVIMSAHWFGSLFYLSYHVERGTRSAKRRQERLFAVAEGATGCTAPGGSATSRSAQPGDRSKAKLLEAAATGADLSDSDSDGLEPDPAWGERGACGARANRTPIYTGALAQCNSSAHGNRSRRYNRTAGDGSSSPLSRSRGGNMAACPEAPPPYTPTPQLPPASEPAPPPYSVDTPVHASSGSRESGRPDPEQGIVSSNNHDSLQDDRVMYDNLAHASPTFREDAIGNSGHLATSVDEECAAGGETCVNAKNSASGGKHTGCSSVHNHEGESSERENIANEQREASSS